MTGSHKVICIQTLPTLLRYRCFRPVSSPNSCLFPYWLPCLFAFAFALSSTVPKRQAVSADKHPSHPPESVYSHQDQTYIQLNHLDLISTRAPLAHFPIGQPCMHSGSSVRRLTTHYDALPQICSDHAYACRWRLGCCTRKPMAFKRRSFLFLTAGKREGRERSGAAAYYMVQNICSIETHIATQ